MKVFMYDGKHVKYWKHEDDVYIYEDPVLRSEGEKDYLIRIEEKRGAGKSMMKTRSISENSIFFQI